MNKSSGYPNRREWKQRGSTNILGTRDTKSRRLRRNDLTVKSSPKKKWTNIYRTEYAKVAETMQAVKLL